MSEMKHFKELLERTTARPFAVSDTSIITEHYCIAAMDDVGEYAAPNGQPEANAKLLTLAANHVEALVAQLLCQLPVNAIGQCVYCGVGSKPDSDGIHADKDNCWGDDAACYNHPRYDDARALLASIEEAARGEK